MRALTRLLLPLSLPLAAIPAALPASAAADLTGCAYITEIPLASDLGEVDLPALTPDGTRVIFATRSEALVPKDIWTVPATGGTPTRLTAAPAGAEGATYLEVLDNNRLLVIGDLTVAGRDDLYTVPLDGSPAVRLSPDALATATVDGFVVSPDRSRVAFWGPIAATGRDDVFVASVNGPVGAQLSPVAGTVATVAATLWTPDSTHVLYVSDHTTAGQFLLYSSNAPSAEPAQLVSTSVATGNVLAQIVVTPDSQSVFYGGDLETDMVPELYKNDVSDPAVQAKVSAAGAALGDSGLQSFFIAPDGSRIAWVGDFEDILEPAAQPLLYSRDVALATPQALISTGSHVNPGSGQIRLTIAATFTADSARIVYAGDMTSADDIDVYATPAAGGTPAILSPQTNPSRDATNYRVTPDSSRVVFAGDFTTEAHEDVYTAPITGGAVQLTTFPNPTSNVASLALNPDGSRVVIHADGHAEGANDLYAAPTAGPAAFMVNNPSPVVGQDVNSFTVHSTVVTYVADYGAVNVERLYIGSLFGPGQEAALLPIDGGVGDSTFTGFHAAGLALGVTDRVKTNVDRLSTVWIGDEDADGVVDTCDPDAVPGVAVAATATTVTLTFSTPTNQPTPSSLDTILVPPAGHTWGSATAIWTSPTVLTITRAANTTVGVGDVLNVASAWGLRRQLNRSPILVGALPALTGTAPGGGTTTITPFTCPTPPPSTPFTDITGSFAAAEIACLYGAGLVSGTSSTTYSPTNPVTREQMAIFLVNSYRTATGVDPAEAANPFTDIASSFAHGQILKLVSLGITAGTSATTYSPQDTVTRDQMAVFLVRLYEAIRLSPAPTGPTPFTDIAGNFAADRIAQLVTLGITAGTSATTYGPTQPVTREQMAVFVVRLLTTATT